ncbi:hypothetical protein MTO96_025546 [Rhipicephalus appendiculatus]
MASSDHQQTGTVQPEVEEKWVFLQDGGDADGGLQPGDATGDKQSVPPELTPHDLEKLVRWCRSGTYDMSDLMETIQNAAVRLETARDTERFFWWWHSAWNDAFIRNALWEDKRLYALFAVLFVYTVLHVLAGVASLAESNALQAVIITLEHFAKATLSAAAFSVASRFVSLTAVKASLVDNSRQGDTIQFLFMTNALILLVACYACTQEVGTAIQVFQEALREENLEWFPRLLADVAMVYALTASIGISASLVVRMVTDVKVTEVTGSLHFRKMAEYRKPRR